MSLPPTSLLDPAAGAQPTQDSSAPTPAANQAPASSNGSGAVQGPHAGLVNYIQQLAVGVGAFAQSAATGGKEGGPAAVQAFEANKQNMALKAQAAQNEAQDHALRMKTGVADYNIKQAQLAQMIQDMPQRHQLLSDEVQNSQLDLLLKKGVPIRTAVAHVEGQSTADHVAAVNTAANGDLTANYAIPTYGPNGPGKGGGSTSVVPSDGVMGMRVSADDVGPNLRALQGVVDEAKSVLGADSQTAKVAQGKLDMVKNGLGQDGTMAMSDWLSLQGINTEIHSAMQQKKDLTDFQQKQQNLMETQQKNDPLFKMENDPNEMSGEKSASAIALLNSKLSDPALPPDQIVRVTRLLGQANTAHRLFQQDQIQKANADQAAKQGDPAAAGALLASGDLTLADMKTRGMTPKFILSTVAAAKKVDPTYKAADEIAAEKVANSPAQNNFFGSANSLLAKGGTLDQLQQNYNKLPNGQFPLFNKVSDYVDYAKGNPATAGFVQTAIGAADDYAKVMGGGHGSDSARLEILHSFAQSHGPEQMKAAIDSARAAVGSQVDSRIGTNKMLRRMYGQDLPTANNPNNDPFAAFGGKKRQ